MKIEKKLLNYS